jgi:opacity protein-like surface antigen
MTCIRGTMALGAVLILGGVSAEAADLYGGRGGSLRDYGYTPAMIERPGASWYVRMDVGVLNFDTPIMQEHGIYDLVDTSIDRAWTLGGGFGTHFTRSVRGELTVDHKFESDVEGRLFNSSATLPGMRKFGLTSTLLLASIYYDFTGFSNRFTPYIGAGLGGVHHRTSAGTVTSGCGCTGTIASNDDWHVAGALMAGVSVVLRGGEPAVAGGGSIKDAPVIVDSGRALRLDLGYRFLYLGEVETGEVRATLNGPPTSVVTAKDPTVENIHGHEFRVGLRYDIR